MSLTDEEVREALETCASEPIHIPGCTQPFACLMSVDPQTKRIMHVSANSAAFIGIDPDHLLGKDVSDIFGPTAWHSVLNALSASGMEQQLRSVGAFEIGGAELMLHAYQNDQAIIVECEHAQTGQLSEFSSMTTLTHLMQTIERCATEGELLDTTARLMRDLTQIDRVMVYRFDAEFNGEVLAEARRKWLESFLNLRFPHWDIPAQARAIMAKLPLRFIEDIDQAPVDLVAADDKVGPLDISMAASRGVSPVHIEYLRNLDVKSTMTLSIKVEDTLWGIISFHHGRSYVPSASLRDVLTHFGTLFSTKLLVLRQKTRLELSYRVDELKDEIVTLIETDQGFEAFSKSVQEIMNADGLVIAYGESFKTAGQVPDPSVVEHLRSLAEDSEAPFHVEAMSKHFPNLSNALNGCAGALVATSSPDRTFFVFRKEVSQKIAWAGNPDKAIEDHDGKKRISPRGSFSTYLATVEGCAAPWSDQDQYFAKRIWSLLNSVERRELITSMARQQKIMIDELNHRVRNILALIRSVSQQARQDSYGSFESYSQSLDARIQALAASHDLTSGSLAGAVPITDLITTEFAPYSGTDKRFIMTGAGKSLRADVAPIFSLVIHELLTNAVKYGALSNEDGHVELALTDTERGLDITWLEVNGPPLIIPEKFGFGTTLIRQAIPYELDGEADLRFDGTGVKARFHLPNALFDEAEVVKRAQSDLRQMCMQETQSLETLLGGTTCWVIEDNFVIATGMRTQLERIGVRDVETFSNVDVAIELLEEEAPAFAILDVNLGAGKTSFPLAEQLLKHNVPFFFVSGYGEAADYGKLFRHILVVTKPASNENLMSAIFQVLSPSNTAED